VTTLAHISDLHFGRIDPAAVEPLIDDLFQLKPDLIVISGDLTQRARQGQYQDARRLLERMPIPQIIVPGNHDVPLFSVLRRSFDPYGRFRQFITGDEYPEFENGDVHIVGINTACRLAPRLGGFWKDGKIRPRHLKALERIFGAVSSPPCAQGGGKGKGSFVATNVQAHESPSPQPPPGVSGGGVETPIRILVAHHPFIEPPGGHRHGTIHGGGRAVLSLERLGINLILGGHIHLSYHGDLRRKYPQLPRAIINVLAGSATSTRRREAHCAYNVLRVGNRVCTLSVRRLMGTQWVASDELGLAIS